MPKFTDSQLVILSTAARREGSAVLPLPRSLKIKGAATTGVLKSLIKKGPARGEAGRRWRRGLAQERSRQAQGTCRHRGWPAGDRDRIG